MNSSSLRLLQLIVVCLVVYCLYMGFIFLPMQQQSTVSTATGRASPYTHPPNPNNCSREKSGCAGVRLFAILTTQRSGSGWFETLLNSHVNITSNGEIFGPKIRRANFSSIMTILDQVYNLEWFSSASKNQSTAGAAVGFKWMLNQGLMENHEEVSNYFKTRGVSIILLFRRNLLRRMISILANSHDQTFKLLNGVHKSHVHSAQEAAILASFKPTINTTSLISDLQSMERETHDALFYFNTTRHITLFYEDLIRDEARNLSHLLNFLQMPDQKLLSKQFKIHIKPLSEQVDNWQDVYNTLKGTPYQRFLDQ